MRLHRLYISEAWTVYHAKLENKPFPNKLSGEAYVLSNKCVCMCVCVCGGGGVVQSNPLGRKVSFSWEILDKSDKFGIPYLP